MSFIGLFAKDIDIEGADGKKYRLSPIGFKEAAEFCLWLKFRPFDIAKEQIKNLPKELADEILKTTWEECKNTIYQFDDDVVLKAMASPDGVAKMLYYSLRIKHPEIKEDEISSIVNINNWQDIAYKLDVISGLVPEQQGESIPQTM